MQIDERKGQIKRKTEGEEVKNACKIGNIRKAKEEGVNEAPSVTPRMAGAYRFPCSARKTSGFEFHRVNANVPRPARGGAGDVGGQSGTRTQDQPVMSR